MYLLTLEGNAMSKTIRFNLDKLEHDNVIDAQRHPEEIALPKKLIKKTQKRTQSMKNIHGHFSKMHVWPVRSEKSPNQKKQGHRKV